MPRKVYPARHMGSSATNATRRSEAAVMLKVEGLLAKHLKS
jgi:hypothetical protein